MEKRNILVIDDSLTARMKLKDLLEEEGAKVEVAETGEEGSALAQQFHPDVIILDVVLSDCDGIQLCQGWQEDPELKYIPVLLVSGERAGQDDRGQVAALDPDRGRHQRLATILRLERHHGLGNQPSGQHQACGNQCSFHTKHTSIQTTSAPRYSLCRPG